MAREYPASAYGYWDSTLAQSNPWTASFRFRENTVGSGYHFCVSVPAAADRNNTAYTDGSGNVTIRVANGSSFATPNNNSSPYSSGVWGTHAFECSFNASSRIAQNVTLMTVNMSVAEPSPTRIVLMAYLASSTYTAIGTKQLAEFGLWDVALTNDEHASIARGFPMKRIRPQSSKICAQFVREIKELRALAGAFTEAGSPTIYDHPRTYGM